MQGVIRQTDALRSRAKEGGGAAVLEKWKARGKGKMGVRERSELLHSLVGSELSQVE